MDLLRLEIGDACPAKSCVVSCVGYTNCKQTIASSTLTPVSRTPTLPQQHQLHTRILTFQAFQTSAEVLLYVKIAFLCGFSVFLLLLVGQALYERSWNSSFGAKAANRVLLLSKILIIPQLASSAFLLWLSLNYDMIIARTSWPRWFVGTNNEVSMLHKYPRPFLSLLFIGIGVGGAYHSSFSILCILCCLLEIAENTISAVEIREYLNLINTRSAPLGDDYTKSLLIVYMGRDIVSIGLCAGILFCMCHYLVLVGMFERRIGYDEVSGGGFDRPTTMREQREIELKKRLRIEEAENKRLGRKSGERTPLFAPKEKKEIVRDTKTKSE